MREGEKEIVKDKESDRQTETERQRKRLNYGDLNRSSSRESLSRDTAVRRLVATFGAPSCERQSAGLHGGR